MKKLIAFIALIFLLGCSGSMTSKTYQKDADIMRLRHLKYYGQLLEEFHEKTGRYPFQGQTKLQNYVKIANSRQLKYAKGGPPYEHKNSSVEEFRVELEKGLKRKIRLKFDPQFEPVVAPNFYIYMVEGNTYYFAVHLFEPKTFTKEIATNYNKVEITNLREVQQGQWNYDNLISNSDFMENAKKTASKEGFFVHLEEQYH